MWLTSHLRIPQTTVFSLRCILMVIQWMTKCCSSIAQCHLRKKTVIPDPFQVIKNKTRCFSPDIHHNATNTQTGNSGKMLTYGANIEQSIALHPIPSKAAIAYSSRNLQKWEMPLQWKPWMMICCILCRHIKNFSILKKQDVWCYWILGKENFGDYKKYDRQMVHSDPDDTGI